MFSYCPFHSWNKKITVIQLYIIRRDEIQRRHSVFTAQTDQLAFCKHAFLLNVMPATRLETLAQSLPETGKSQQGGEEQVRARCNASAGLHTSHGLFTLIATTRLSPSSIKIMSTCFMTPSSLTFDTPVSPMHNKPHREVHFLAILPQPEELTGCVITMCDGLTIPWPCVVFWSDYWWEQFSNCWILLWTRHLRPC